MSGYGASAGSLKCSERAGSANLRDLALSTMTSQHFHPRPSRTASLALACFSGLSLGGLCLSKLEGGVLAEGSDTSDTEHRIPTSAEGLSAT